MVDTTDRLIRIHFYENISYLFDSSNNIRQLNGVQTQILRAILKYKERSKIVTSLCDTLKMDEVSSECALSQFLSTYGEFFYLRGDDAEHTLRLSGIEGKRLPYMLTVSLTSACCHRCRHCLSDIQNKAPVEISYNILCEFLNAMTGSECDISLTGGEPLLYSKFEDIVREYGKSYSFSVVTSGYNVNHVSDNALRNLSSILVSLHGGNAAQHDGFVQRSGSFNCVSSFISRLLSLGIDVSVTTQAKDNRIEPLRHIIEHCISLGVKHIKIGELVPLGQAKTMPGVWDSYDNIVVQKNVARLSDEYKSQILIEIDDERTNTNFCMNNCFFRCGGGCTKWFISEYGEIFPCMLAQEEQFCLGNIYDKSSYMRLLHSRDYFETKEKSWFRNSLSTRKLCENMGGILL